jgi:FtsZ-interacting cell division protein ZipA
LKKNNIILIIIVIIAIIALIGLVTIYEQQQVKIHLTNANTYHTEAISYNAAEQNDSLSQAIIVMNTQVAPLLPKELAELQAANTMFASSEQKQYITAAIELNRDNVELNGISNTAYKHYTSGDYVDAATDNSNSKNIQSNELPLTQTLNGLVAQYPNEFGFNITGGTSSQ